MKTKLIILTILMVLSVAFCFAQTPAKPYPDVIDGDVLTATWLMGTFNTLYNWAQTTNASVSLLMGGISYGSPITASLTTSIASPTQYLVWDSTGLNYTSSASGSYFFDLILNAVATAGANVAAFKITGTMISNATGTDLVGSNIVESWVTSSQYAASIATHPTRQGAIQVIASSPATVKWKARLQAHDSTY